MGISHKMMKLLFSLGLYLFSFTLCFSQEKIDVKVQLDIDSMEIELPETLSFLPISIKKEKGTAYIGKSLSSGDYRLRIRILNYEIVDSLIHVGINTKNNHFIKMRRIINTFSFESDFKNQILKLYILENGPSVFNETKLAEKFKSKFDVTIVSSYNSCFLDNTDYEIEYSRKVIMYLDEEFGGRWRRFLKRHNLKPYE